LSALLATLLFAAAVAGPRAQATPGRETVVFAGPAMGTRYSVQVVMAPGDAAAQEQVRSAIAAELGLVDRLFSRWNPASEVSRFNAFRSTEAFAVSAELLAAVRVAQRAAERSGGAFDLTVAPLVEAWGFGPSARPPTVPAPPVLAAARVRVGYALVSRDEARSSIRKARPDVAIDLDGLAGGWLADRIASAIVALGHADVLADAGGEVCARGRRADGQRWRVAVESPAGARAARRPVLEVDDVTVTTSGDYRAFWTDEQGRRRSHTLDPRSGEPVDHGLASVTVVDPNGVWADALDTALLVLGPTEARALATREGLAARLVERRADGSYAEWSTPSFQALARR
jgi:thiamine biosynthesis lipoprotein